MRAFVEQASGSWSEIVSKQTNTHKGRVFNVTVEDRKRVKDNTRPSGPLLWRSLQTKTLNTYCVSENVCFLCHFVLCLQVFALYLSTYITVAISLDRCVAILDPMRRNGATYRVRVMIGLGWVFSAIFSIPQVR